MDLSHASNRGKSRYSVCLSLNQNQKRRREKGERRQPGSKSTLNLFTALLMTPFHRCLSAACLVPTTPSLSTCPLLLSPRPHQADSGLTHPASSPVAKKKGRSCSPTLCHCLPDLSIWQKENNPIKTIARANIALSSSSSFSLPYSPKSQIYPRSCATDHTGNPHNPIINSISMPRYLYHYVADGK